MLPPKALFDSISSHVTHLLGSENPLPRAEVEAQFKALIQSAFSKLDLVSREEFDVQTKVLLRTREKLQALEEKLQQLEKQLAERD